MPTGDNRFGRYVVQEKLGGGGMAVVYRAINQETGRTIALKILRGNVAEESDVLERFRQEALIAQRLQHSHIVQIYNSGAVRGRFFLEVQYMPGGTLAQRFKNPLETSIQETMRWLRQIASALDYAHVQGIIHRDMKLENILLDDENNVYLADFGIARVIDKTRMTAAGNMMGTPLYISPEQARGEVDINFRTDLYSLAVIAYVLLVGRFPFIGDNVLVILNQHLLSKPPLPTDLNSELPESLDTVLLKGLAKRPEERYPSADAFVEALSLALTDLKTTTTVDMWTDHTGKKVTPLIQGSLGDSANDYYRKALETHDQDEVIRYLKQALELDPLHSDANRLLSRIEGATPAPMRRMGQPTLTPDPGKVNFTPREKTKIPTKSSSPWSLIMLLGVSGVLIFALIGALLIISGTVRLDGSNPDVPPPVLEINGTPAKLIPGIVLTVQPLESHIQTLRLGDSRRAILEAGRSHEYRFTANSGQNIVLTLYFSSGSLNVFRNTLVIDPLDNSRSNNCVHDTSVQDQSRVIYNCRITISGTWRIRLFGVRGEGAGDYTITLISQ